MGDTIGGFFGFAETRWRASTADWTLRGPDNEPISVGGPANGYAAGFTIQRAGFGNMNINGVRYRTSYRVDSAEARSVIPLNGASGLHPLTVLGSDDSGIDGVPASNLTSLESYHFGSDVFAHDVKVMVVTVRR